MLYQNMKNRRETKCPYLLSKNLNNNPECWEIAGDPLSTVLSPTPLDHLHKVRLLLRRCWPAGRRRGDSIMHITDSIAQVLLSFLLLPQSPHCGREDPLQASFPESRGLHQSFRSAPHVQMLGYFRFALSMDDDTLTDSHRFDQRWFTILPIFGCKCIELMKLLSGVPYLKKMGPNPD